MPRAGLYSLTFREGPFWEVGMRDLARIDAPRAIRGAVSASEPEELNTIVVVSHKNAEPCMTSGKISYRRGPDTSGFLPSQFPLWVAGFVTRFARGGNV